jgi:hypothetical protein
VNYGEVFWGVLSTFAAFLLGLMWERLARFITNIRARRFWRPLVNREAVVVVGSFRKLPGFEASGVIGLGDNIALNDLERYFAAIGFKRFEVHYNDHFVWAYGSLRSTLEGNLILLGGPDANVLTRLVLERLTLGIEFLEVSPGRLRADAVRPDGVVEAKRRRRLVRRPADPAPPWRVPVVRDKETGHLHGPTLTASGISSDCAVMIRSPNPFNEDREVIIFCGSYGYGTWAAVRYAQTDEFLRKVPKDTPFLECVLSVDIIRDTPQGIHLEFLRPLGDATVSGARNVVPRILD